MNPGMPILRTFLLHVKFENVTLNNRIEQVIKFTGFEAKLLNALSSTINFTFTLHETKTGFGTKLPNNTWTGIVGELATNETDLAIAFLADTYQRRTVIDYSKPYYAETLNFYIGPQVSSREKRVLFLSPFDLKIWIVLLFYIIMLCIILKILTPTLASDHLWAIIYVIGIMTTQSRKILIERPLSSLVLSFCLVPLTILSIYYGDVLKASTSVWNSGLIDSLEKLANLFTSGELNIGVFTGTFIEDFVKNSPKSSEYGDLYRKVSIPMKLNFKNLPDLKNNNLAIISPGKAFVLLLDYFGNRNFKFYKIEEHLFNYNIAMGFKKKFLCKPVFDDAIVALMESGCLSRWEEEMERHLNLKEMKNTPMYTADYIGSTDLRSTFFLWFSGLFIATIFFVSTSYYKFILKYL